MCNVCLAQHSRAGGAVGNLAEEHYLTPELPPSDSGNSIIVSVLNSLGSSFRPMTLEG